MIIENSPSIYTVTEVMKILKCSRATVYKFIADGVFPAKRIDRKHRIPVQPFLRWLYADDKLEA
ncbi:MAG: helix-turn-helix domain-containing protein [Clostridiales bacterium]|nr:helix-turn-helix domain-containing protein [Clostridiales bacterium]